MKITEVKLLFSLVITRVSYESMKQELMGGLFSSVTHHDEGKISEGGS